MKLRIASFAAFAALFTGAADAQAPCPRTKAETVASTVEFHGVVPCGAVQFQVGSATFSGPNQGCPLLAVLVPEHERETPQTNGALTQAKVYAQVTTRVYHFACQREWLLFIPWDSTCGLVSESAGAVLPRMTTAPCSQAASGTSGP